METNIEEKIKEHNQEVESELKRAGRGEFICISEILAAKEKLYERLKQNRGYLSKV